MARTRRRDLKKELFWREMVRGQFGSGLSVRAWCRRHGVREPAFYWWRRRLADRGATNSAASKRAAGHSATTFLPVRVADDAIGAGIAAADVNGASAGRIEIVLAAGYRVQVLGRVDRQALADVLAVLTSDGLAGEAGGNGRAAETCGNGRITEAGARPVRGVAHSC